MYFLSIFLVLGFLTRVNVFKNLDNINFQEFGMIWIVIFYINMLKNREVMEEFFWWYLLFQIKKKRESDCAIYKTALIWRQVFFRLLGYVKFSWKCLLEKVKKFLEVEIKVIFYVTGLLGFGAWRSQFQRFLGFRFVGVLGRRVSFGFFVSRGVRFFFYVF